MIRPLVGTSFMSTLLDPWYRRARLVGQLPLHDQVPLTGFRAAA